jgi:hypothetical protein
VLCFDKVLNATNLANKYQILQQMGREKKHMCRGLFSTRFSLDHKSLKIAALDVEKSFTCC